MKKGPTLYQLLSRTPQGRIVAAALKKKQKKNPELLGKFLPGLTKKLKAIGKVTSKVTGSIAKVAAGMVGIPPSAINALAKIDPTAKKKLDAALLQTKAGAQAAAVVNAAQSSPGSGNNLFSNIKPVYIVAGAAGLAAVVFIISNKKK